MPHMAENPTQRRPAAILAADVVGHSRLIEQDENGTLEHRVDRRSSTATAGTTNNLLRNH
jgi:adenylate cyclase